MRMSLSPLSSGDWPNRYVVMIGMVTMPMISATPTIKWLRLAMMTVRLRNMELGSRVTAAVRWR